MAAVEVSGLRKTYGDLVAVDGIDLEIAEGEVLAILGPNGAGKTTTVEMLEGYRTPDAGTVRVLGADPQTGGRAWRERIGIVLQEAGFEELFTPRELIRLHAGWYPHPRAVDEVLAMVGLEDKADARVRTLSGGQRRRLDLGLGIVGSPELLFLDEPTTGFDPSARRRAWDLVDRLRDTGATILLTTHYLDEAQHLADRLVVVDHGRVVAQGTAEQLAASAGLGAVIGFRLPDGVEVGDLPDLGERVAVLGQVAEIRTSRPTADVATLAGWAVARGVELVDLTLTRPSLEQVYLDLVGAEAADVDVARARRRGAPTDGRRAAPARRPGAPRAARLRRTPVVMVMGVGFPRGVLRAAVLAAGQRDAGQPPGDPDGAVPRAGDGLVRRRDVDVLLPRCGLRRGAQPPGCSSARRHTPAHLGAARRADRGGHRARPELGRPRARRSGWSATTSSCSPGRIAAVVVALLLGSLCFAVLGLLLGALAPSQQAAVATSIGLVIPLSFVSDVFMAGSGMPDWMTRLGWFFPLKHMAVLVGDALNPYLDGSGFQADHLAALAGFTVAGGLVAAWALRRDTDPVHPGPGRPLPAVGPGGAHRGAVGRRRSSSGR